MNTLFDLRVMGLVLRQGRRLNALSWLLLGLAGLWLVLDAGVTEVALDWLCLGLLWSSVLAGLVQLFFAMRADFDADLLLALADAHGSGEDAQAAAATLDRSLVALQLADAARTGRDWPARWRGARGLLLRQLLCLLVQAAGLIAVWLFVVLE